MTEKLIREYLKEIGKSNGLEFWRLETHGSTTGLADLLYAGHGTGGVMELKVGHGSRRIYLDFRPGQRSFLVQHFRGNPRTFVLLSSGLKYYLINGKDSFPAEYSSEKELRDGSVWTGDELDYTFIQRVIHG